MAGQQETKFGQLEVSRVVAGELSQVVPSLAGDFAVKRERRLSWNPALAHPHASPRVSGTAAPAAPAWEPQADSATSGQRSPWISAASHSWQLFNYQPTTKLNAGDAALIAPADGPGWPESGFIITSGELGRQPHWRLCWVQDSDLRMPKSRLLFSPRFSGIYTYEFLQIKTKLFPEVEDRGCSHIPWWKIMTWSLQGVLSCIHTEGNIIYWPFPVYQTLSWALLRGAGLFWEELISIPTQQLSGFYHASFQRENMPLISKSRSVWGCVPDEKYEEMIFLIIVKQFNTAQWSWVLESKTCGFSWLWILKPVTPAGSLKRWRGSGVSC